jgi:hypothetical protein
VSLGRRLCAFVIVLALGLSGPLSAPRTCVSCPVGCPMHRDAEAGQSDHAATRRKPSCHRTPTPAGEVCLRSVCGAGATLETSALVGLVAGRERGPERLVLAVTVAPAARRAPSGPVLEPPTEPPRALLV